MQWSAIGPSDHTLGLGLGSSTCGQEGVVAGASSLQPHSVKGGIRPSGLAEAKQTAPAAGVVLPYTASGVGGWAWIQIPGSL